MIGGIIGGAIGLALTGFIYLWKHKLQQRIESKIFILRFHGEHNLEYQTKDCMYGENIKLPVPEIENNEFIGWFSDLNCLGVSRESVIVYSDIDLYPKWRIKQ